MLLTHNRRFVDMDQRHDAGSGADHSESAEAGKNVVSGEIIVAWLRLIYRFVDEFAAYILRCETMHDPCEKPDESGIHDEIEHKHGVAHEIELGRVRRR